jgi:hypothetical protein
VWAERTIVGALRNQKVKGQSIVFIAQIPVLKRPEHEAHHSLQYRAEVKRRVSMPPLLRLNYVMPNERVRPKGGVEVKLYSFFNLGIRWGGWSTPRPGHFTPGIYLV